MRDIPQEPCLGLIHEFEKGPDGTFAATPYLDSTGNWTNGWGHRCAQDAPAVTILQANDQALADLAIAAQGVCDAISATPLSDLTEGQYAALIDLTFNIGVQNFTNSTLCHYVNVGALHLVPDQFRVWNKGHVDGALVVLPGLTRRREAEVAVWLR
jgi:lysozyme